AEDFWLAFERPEVSLVGELLLQDVPLALLSPAGVGLEEVGGLLSGRLQLGGTVEDPRPTVELSMRKGVARAVGRPPLHELEIDIAVTGHAVNVSRCGGMVGTTPFSASGELESPAVSLWRLWSGHDAPVRARLQVQNLTLDALPRAWTGLDDLRGRICGTVRLAGSFRRPEPEGNVQLTAGSVKLPRVPRLSDLQGSLEVSATAATLEARGTVGAGPLRLEARMDAGKGRVLEAAETSKITATLVGRDLLLARGPGMRVRADVNLAVAGSPKDMTVDGRLDITSAKFQRRLSLLPDPRLEGGTALTRLGPLALGPPLGERLRFRVDVATKKPAIVRTHVLDADLDAALKLIGPGNALQLQGAVSARSGILRFPGSSMQLETARVLFDPRHPDQPELMVNASGRRYGFETRLVAKGRPGDIEVEMSSVPQLSAKEVMVLITTGVPPDRLASRETRANVGLVGSYVLGELVGSFFASESLEAGESLAERFTFEFGTEVSRHGKETWAVEYDLSHLGLENFAARVEQDIYEDQSVNLIYKIRF
ncbi:MAG: translocation/assembly module TamB domain-containing protein, partial [Planctomycetota bacterium]